MTFKAIIKNMEYLCSAVKIVQERDSDKLEKLEIGDLITVAKPNKKRTITQNSALHLFFKWIADQLNNLGMTFNYIGLKGAVIELPYTGILVKETLWKPIQKVLFELDSTTELESWQINKILDILIKFFGERNIEIKFPNKFDQWVNSLNEEIKKGNFEVYNY